MDNDPINRSDPDGGWDGDDIIDIDLNNGSILKVTRQAGEDFLNKAFGGETTLSFASTTLAKSNLKQGFTESSLKDKPFGIEIGFTTDNVEDTVSTVVNAGATIVENPKTKLWGQIVASVRDIDGFLIEICTPMG